MGVERGAVTVENQASIGLCGIEIRVAGYWRVSAPLPQSDCVELKYQLVGFEYAADVGPQSDCVELK